MAGKTPKHFKHRLDEALVNRGLAPNREKAGALIMAGDILVDGQTVYKADAEVTPDQPVERKEKYPYASRGASKIERAFGAFGIDVNGMKVLDIGISNGGFTDYMLQNGAAAAAGVDVNIQQVDDKLKNDPRVSLIKANARSLEPGDAPFEPDLITMDVSFISVTKILPALSAFKTARVLTLIKPQFEVKREKVGKGGIIRDREDIKDILLELKEKIQRLDYAVSGVTAAGVKGRKGNQEFFFLLDYGKKDSINDRIVTDAIEI